MKKRLAILLTIFLCATTVAMGKNNKNAVAAPAAPQIPDYSAYILTPPAPLTPRINSAKVFGVRPNAEILYTIAATGERPMTFSAEGLPKGVTLDAATGQITGRLAERGTYNITLTATNAKGSNSRELRLVVGDRIALIPAEQAVLSASYLPAKSVGLEAEVGSIACGRAADLLVVDEDWTLERVYIGGVPVH